MNKVIATLFILWAVSLSYIAFKFVSKDLELKQQIIKVDKINESFEEYLRTYGKVNNAFKCVNREIN